MFAEILAFIATGLFAGAALYISLVEHPARMGLGTAIALAEFRPTNVELLDETRTAKTIDTDVLLKKWGRLHNVRTIASMLALVMLGANILGFI